MSTPYQRQHPVIPVLVLKTNKYRAYVINWNVSQISSDLINGIYFTHGPTYLIFVGTHILNCIVLIACLLTAKTYTFKIQNEYLV